jgi:hypothetical protein
VVQSVHIIGLFQYVFKICVVKMLTLALKGGDSILIVATHYGLDGPRIYSRWGVKFSPNVQPALGPDQPPVQWVRGKFHG